MTRDEITQKVVEILRETIDLDSGEPIAASASLVDDLGADSLGLVEVLLSGEEAFDVDISDDDAAQVRTVGDAVALIERLLAGKPAAT